MTFAEILSFFDSSGQKYVIRAAHELANTHLSTIMRRTGESYAKHGEEVACVTFERTKNPSLIACALCHDIHLHPRGEEILRKSFFSESERNIIRSMHQLRRLHVDENTDDLEFAIQSFLENADIALLRLAHRVNDIRHITRFLLRLQKTISRETLFLYGVIAGSLGISAWRRELEDISFSVLHPRYFQKVLKSFSASSRFDNALLEKTETILREKMQRENIPAQIHKRMKGIYSTYKKLLLHHQSFREIPDRIAIRIITENEKDCYHILGIVHRLFPPSFEGFRDYIAAPKENGYQSLHTLVSPFPGENPQRIEVQIRTHRMHSQDEFGLASHARYKNAKYALTKGKMLGNLERGLLHLRAEVKSPEHFEQLLKSAIRERHIIIFDKENTPHTIDAPATLLDVACLLYKKRSAFIKEVRLNGRLEELASSVRNGDSVSFSFSRKKQATKKWALYLNQTKFRSYFL
ncbi:bifunctional (p)ppGpp synthetase/guanosine-3',5'-bis(diphosphate) 3'-pyrophosphohydrolase [Candidatus Peregrinibacteria bacterium]|nr:MAG: bifunctional (p)ppGpp synthetase/guanosine-3',5'-bis(diphosphate) 3'-pyrophosphohydrolase [Candidatus Peregrinibacteria bacterium]